MRRGVCLLLSLFLVFGSLGQNVSYAKEPLINQYFSTLEIGKAFNYRSLTIVPLYTTSIKDRTNYVTLDEAVREGYITITELGGGRVPQVKITNNSNHYILLVCGEILTGGKQDRLVGRDALIAPKSKNVILPVYCSERHRWVPKTEYFSSGESQAEPYLRGMLYGGKTQAKVWGRIDEYSYDLNISSPTAALQDVYRDPKLADEMNCYVEKLMNIPRLEEDAVGVVVALDGKIIGIDMFANPKLFASLWPKLLKSYVALAISHKDSGGTLAQEEVKELLNEIVEEKFSQKSGLDLGKELQANTSGMICSALVYRKGVIHLGAFPANGESNRTPGDRIPVLE